MMKPGDRALARKPEAYLRAVENMVYGDDPRQGSIEGPAFYHPVLRFEFAVPSGWKVDNTPSRVTLVSGDKNGGVIFQGGKTADSPEEIGRNQAAEITGSGGKLLEEKRTTVNGLACLEQSSTITQEGQAPIRMRRSYVKKGDMAYVFSAMSSEQGFPQYEPAFRQVVGSFRELTDPKFINRAPKRLALVKADGSATLQAIFKKAGMPETAAAQFAVMNGMELGAVPSAGKLVKVVK